MEKLKTTFAKTIIIIPFTVLLAFIILSPLSEKNYQDALIECQASSGDDSSVETIMYNHGFFFGGVLDREPNLIMKEVAYLNKYLKIFN